MIITPSRHRARRVLLGASALVSVLAVPTLAAAQQKADPNAISST